MDSKSLEKVTVEQIDTIKNLINIISEFIVKYSFQVLGGLIVLGLGWYVATLVGNWIEKFLRDKQIDITVSKFIAGAVKLSVIGFAIIVAMGKFGIEIAPFIAGISVIGFGTSFALQGPLSNYAAGITLIFTKPFKVGDVIEVAGVQGEVQDILLPRTEIKTVDGNKIVIPNKHIIGEIVHNYSNSKRIDLVIGVAYSSDMNQVLDIISKVVAANEKVIREKDPVIGIDEFADSSVNVFVRVWSNQDDYFQTKFALNKSIFDALNNNNIEIPFPQRDVHIINKDT